MIISLSSVDLPWLWRCGGGHEVRGGHEVDSMERSLDPTFRSKWPWDAVAMVDPKGPQGGMQDFFPHVQYRDLAILWVNWYGILGTSSPCRAHAGGKKLRL